MTISQRLSNSTFSDYDRSPCQNVICHIGIGQFHRSHQALYLHKLKSISKCNWQITGLGILPNDAEMQSKLLSQDLLYSVLSLGKQPEVTVVGSMLEYLTIANDGHAAVIDAIIDPRCKIVTLTITEHGYLQDNHGNLNFSHPAVINDLSNPEKPQSIYGLLYSALKARHCLGRAAFTIMSCDNLPSNGSLIKHLLLQFILKLEPGLASWVENSTRFPNTMVDRITPKTTEAHSKMLEEMGIVDQWPVVAEDYTQWIIEDSFTARPALELVGVTFTTNVREYEEIKLFLLNAGHSAIAYLSLLSSIEHVDEAMKNEEISSFVHNYMNLVIPVVPKIHSLDINAYVQTLLVRFSNPHIKDQTSRLASNGHAKLTSFVVQPLQRLIDRGKDTSAVATLIGSWIIYLATWDESKIEDEMKATLCPAAKRVYKSRLFEELKKFMNLAFPQLVDCDEFLQEIVRSVEIIGSHGFVGGKSE